MSRFRLAALAALLVPLVLSACSGGTGGDRVPRSGVRAAARRGRHQPV